MEEYVMNPWTRGRLASLHGVAISLFANALAAPASAQEVAAPPPPEPVQTVEVTGSHIRRIDAETATPVQVITRQDIERTGAVTVQELMNNVSANFGGFNDQLSVGAESLGNTPGLASLNLRGIGSDATLVLVDGRRVANYAFDGGAVDVNSIPLAAIDRVEILKDGASAIYGTDAIAGVVNFILRKDYRGVELTGRASVTQHGGAGHRQATALVGGGNPDTDGFNGFVMLDHQHDDALRATQRSFSRTGYLPQDGLFLLSTISYPANVLTPSQVLLSPALASGCAPPTSIPVSNWGANPICGYDTPSLAELFPQTDRTAAFGRATLHVSDELEFFGELGLSHNHQLARFSADPIRQAFTHDDQPIVYPAGGPFYPTAFAQANGLSGDLNLLYRLAELGPRTNAVDTDALRAVAGAKGRFAGWDYDTSILYSDTRQADDFVSGWASETGVVAGLATGLINPFGPSGPQGLALLDGTRVSGVLHRASGSTTLIDARASRELFRLPAGPVQFALGVEHRGEQLRDDFALPISSGDLIGVAPSAPVSESHRRVEAIYAEASVPVAHGLETQLAVRGDRYSDFSTAWNPKLAVRWQPIKPWMLRASWGTGFRAPTLIDIHSPESEGLTRPQDDPVRCPVTHLVTDCDNEFIALTGGNLKLRPERSRNFNLGTVWEPQASISVSVDWWQILRTHTIGGIPEDSLFTYYQRFASAFARGPVDPAFPNLPGPILSVDERTQNAGDLRTSGIDLGVHYRSAATNAGRLEFTLNGTLVNEWREQLDGVNYVSGLGNNFIVPVSRWRQNMTVTWEAGAWTATLAHSFQAGYAETDNSRCDQDDNCALRRVGSYQVMDMQVGYTGLAHARFVLGVKNLLDRKPPFSQDLPAWAVGYDATNADPRGRAVYGSCTISW
jgi:iron complex outermembrane recepter protein